MRKRTLWITCSFGIVALAVFWRYDSAPEVFVGDLQASPHDYNGKRVSVLAYYSPDRRALRAAPDLERLIRLENVPWHLTKGTPLDTGGFARVKGTFVCYRCETPDYSLALKDVTTFYYSWFYKL